MYLFELVHLRKVGVFIHLATGSYISQVLIKQWSTVSVDIRCNKFRRENSDISSSAHVISSVQNIKLEMFYFTVITSCLKKSSTLHLAP